MAERNAWPTQNTGPTGILSVEDTRLGTGFTHTAGATPMLSRTGFRPVGGAGAVLATTPTPDGNVRVGAFQLALQTVRSAVSGPYVVTLDASETINILSTPAHATNPRDDLIIARVTDTFYGDGSSTFSVEQIVGTPAAVPTDPTVSGSQDYVPLARVRVAALATSIAQGNITDLREGGHAKSLTAGRFTVGLGGLLPVGSKTMRDAIAAGALYDGLAVWRTDVNAVNVYDGTEWVWYARPTSHFVATSQTSPSTSYTDLGTVGPTVSVETGTQAKVTLYAGISNTTAAFANMSFAVSGATTIAALDTMAIGGLFDAAGETVECGATFHVTGLTPGTNVFTAKYRVTGGTGTWISRRMMVEPC